MLADNVFALVTMHPCIKNLDCYTKIPGFTGGYYYIQYCISDELWLLVTSVKISIHFQEQIEKASNEREEVGRKLRGKRHKLTLTPATSHSKIPSR